MITHVQSFLCNPYIRARDSALYGTCISCCAKITQAGHRYSVGSFPGMRFMINNIHGQEISCNHFKSGNIDAFDRGIKLRHGEEYLNKLKSDAERYLKQSSSNMDRFDIIQIGETYKYLLENRIWIFAQDEFDKYRDVVNGNI